MALEKLLLALSMKKHINSKKVLVLVCVALLVVAFAFLKSTDNLPWSSFKTIEYNNGSGSVYSLKFYAKYKYDSAADSNTIATKSLVALAGKGNVAPLKVAIIDDIFSYGIPTFAHNNKDSSEYCQSEYTSALITSPKNKYSGSTANICDNYVGSNDAGKEYSGYFKYHGQLVYVVFQLEGGKPGLSAYKDDIAKIVTSIKIKDGNDK